MKRISAITLSIAVIVVLLLSSCRTVEKVVYVDKKIDLDPTIAIVESARPSNDVDLIMECKDTSDVVYNSIIYLTQWEKWEEYARHLERYLAQLSLQLKEPVSS